MNVNGKKITVLGLGESGLKAALFLQKKGAVLWVSESGDGDVIRQRQRVLEGAGIACEIGTHSMERILDTDLVIISPGISPKTDIYQALHKKQIEILSEVELASRFFSGDIIAVSGTDGKSTVTTLIRDILNGCGMRAISCGNIGNPFIGEIESLDNESLDNDTKVVCEVSSFQLYHIKKFKPTVSVLLNVAPDHLDWHYDFGDYVDAKQKLFQNQTSTHFAIVNFQDQVIAKFLCRIKAQKLFFNQFPSAFNPNEEAALTICDIFNLDKEKAESIVKAFPGLEHRMERVPSDDGITYINDSKSTSLHSLLWALERQEKKIILLCGGRNKGLDFATVRQLVSDRVKCAVVFGEAQDEIINAWGDDLFCKRASDVSEALFVARSYVEEGDVVLFSPACTSFDMFSNYKERGKHFKELVLKGN